MRNQPMLVVLVLALGTAAFSNAYALWAADGAPLCTATNSQITPVIISDGAGGAIIAWQDRRSGTYDIYAQRVNAMGVPQWTSDGVAVSTIAGDDFIPHIASDGVGGAIVAWQHLGGVLTPVVYVQRLNPAGVPQWTVDGVALGVSGLGQTVPQLVPDGAGGAFLTWADYASTSQYNIRAQRTNSAGIAQWAANGIAICTDTLDQYVPQIVADGAGGAIIAWQDLRTGYDNDIYAQRVDAAGAPQWTANGVGVCVYFINEFFALEQKSPALISDGAGGAIITWMDNRTSVNFDIYAQRVNTGGASMWTANGIPLCTATNGQFDPMIIPDGLGGAIVAWADQRTGANSDIYVQRVNASGGAQWTSNGVALTSGSVLASLPQLAPDGSGGAIVAWNDGRSGASNYDIYARRVNASGAPQWATDGVALCTAAQNQIYPTITSEGGAAIVAWQDIRSAGTNNDIYALRIGPEGLVPTGVRETPSVSALALTPNQPNPFLAGTTMNLNLPADAVVSIEVFDVAGRRARHIDMGRMNAGWALISFDGRDDSGRLLPSGIYFYRVRAAGETVTRKMVIAR